MSTLQGSGRFVTEGLVFYMDVANTKCYSGTGSTLSDLSIEQNDGNLINGTTYDNQFLGNFSFDGIDDYIEIPFDDSLNPNDAITISSLFYVTGYGSLFAPLIFKQNPSPINFEQYQLGIYSNITQQLRFYITSPGLTQTFVGYNGTFNKVLYAVGTCDTNTDEMKLYINGDLVNSTSYNYDFYTSSNPVTIGGITTGFPGYTNGKIYHSAIYNRALDADEIRNNYQIIKTRYNI